MNLNRRGKNEEGKKGKERKKMQTQGFRECDEVGVGEKEGGDLCDGGEPFGNGGGKDRPRFFQGNRKRGF